MELKQSSAVPFAVTDPISGLDITKDVQLVSIESVGEGDFPYFQPNDDYTFTVVNASRDEIVAPTTFTLDVPYDGEVHRLTATTDMTIEATTDPFMKYQVLKPLASIIIGPPNSVITIEMQTSFRGITLTADDVVIQKHKPGTDPSAYPITFISATTKADGKTLDVKWQGADTMIGPFTFYVLRKKATGLVEGEDWVQVDMNLRFGIAGLRIGPIHDSAEHIRGHQGELINGWFTVYNDGVPIKLNDPGLTLTLQAAANINTIVDVIAIDERFEDHITFKIKGKPNGIDVNEPAGTATGYFYIKATWKGVTAQVMPTLTWYPSTDMISSAAIQQPLFPNQTQKAVTQFGPVNGNGITPWYTIEGATVRAGSIFVNQFDGSGVIQQVVVEPGTPLNSINQLVKEITTSWMKQRVLLSGFVLDLPFITDRTLYQTMWRLNAETTIEMAPIEYRLNTEVVTGIAGRYPSVVISAWQERDGEMVRIPGTYSSATVTGSLQYRGLTPTPDGDVMLQFTTRGVSGEAVANLTFRSADNKITNQTVQVTLRADNTLDIDYEPFVTSTKIWSTFNELPFNVRVNGAIVNRPASASKVKNVKLMETGYVKYVKDSTTEWEIVHALTTETTTRTYFTYDVEVNGVTYNCVGAGDYRIAAWDGVSLVPNAEYIPGDRITKQIAIPTGGERQFTFYPVYEGKPAADKIELRQITGRYFKIKSQEVNEVGDGVVVTLESTDQFASGTYETFYYQVKGIPQNQLVDKKTVVSEYVKVDAVPKGLSVVTATPTPSWVGLNATLIWKPVFRWDGVTIPNNDPNLTVRIVDTGTSGRIAYVTPVSSTVDTTYLIATKYPPSETTYNQYFVVDYVKDGVKYTSAEAVFPVGFMKSREVAPVNVILKADPLANTDNLIPIDVKVATNPPLDPKSIVPLTAPYFKVTPEGSDVVVGKVEYVNTGHLKFSSGYEGGDITYSMTFGSAGSPTTTVPVTFTVPAAPLNVNTDASEINGVTNTVTSISFTVAQERRINGVVEQYNFADGTIGTGSTGTGAIGTVSNIVNTNGTFTADVRGKGLQGEGTAEIILKDNKGVSYTVSIPLTAAIDSSTFLMTLNKNSITGKAGYKEAFTGTLKEKETVLNFNDPWIELSVEPEGWAVIENKTASGFDLKITRSTPNDETQEVKIKANYYGMIAEQPVTVNAQSNLTITKQTPNVKVWDIITTVPFTIKDASNVTITPVDLARQPNPNIQEMTPAGRYQITSDVARPAGPLVVVWEYRLPDDLPGTVRTIDITYNVAEYDGNILTYKLAGDTVLTFGKKTNLSIDVYIKGVRTTSNIGYVGVGPGTQYLNYNTSYVASAGQYVITFTTGTKQGIEVVQKWKLKVLDGYEGNPGGEFTVDQICTIWDPNNALFVSPFEPDSITGKFGDTFVLKCKAMWQGNRISMKNVVPMTMDPTGIIVYDNAAATEESLTVRFSKDITENKRVQLVKTSFGFNVYPARSVVDLNTTQIATVLKLTPAPGFESTGSGDMENPVTLKQGVLDPE